MIFFLWRICGKKRLRRKLHLDDPPYSALQSLQTFYYPKKSHFHTITHISQKILERKAFGDTSRSPTCLSGQSCSHQSLNCEGSCLLCFSHSNFLPHFLQYWASTSRSTPQFGQTLMFAGDCCFSTLFIFFLSCCSVM